MADVNMYEVEVGDISSNDGSTQCEPASGPLPEPLEASLPGDDTADGLDSMQSSVPLPAALEYALIGEDVPASGAASGSRASEEVSETATASRAGGAQSAGQAPEHLQPADAGAAASPDGRSKEARGNLGAFGKVVPEDELPSFAGEPPEGFRDIPRSTMSLRMVAIPPPQPTLAKAVPWLITSQDRGKGFESI